MRNRARSFRKNLTDAEAIEYDEKRTAFLEKNGYRVLRFWNNDIFINIDSVLATILAQLETVPK